MGEVNAPILSLNAGMVAKTALGRIDLGKLQMATEDQTNWLPKVMGPTIFRPGFEHKTGTRANLFARLIPFIFNTDQKACLELTDGYLRAIIDGLPVSRPSVGSGVAALTAWSSIDEAGCTSFFFGAVAQLNGTGFNLSGRRTSATTTTPGIEHALRVNVGDGPILFRVGTSAGLDDLIALTSLDNGFHSLAFTPPGDTYWIDIQGYGLGRVVNEVSIEPAGDMLVATPWNEASVRKLRFDQSGDVLFCATGTEQQQRIERRSQRSWSVVDYRTSDGPFKPDNTTSTVLTLDGTGLHANRPTFQPGHVGALFRLTTSGQGYAVVLAGDEQWTSPVRVTGVSSDGSGSRQIGVTVSGTFAGTLRLQRSLGVVGAWTDVAGQTYTAGGSYSYDDGYDNQIIFYRVGFKAGGYASGAANVGISYAGGSQNGLVRIASYVSPLLVVPEIITAPTAAGTTIWAEGQWSDYRGWPTSVALHDGRLFWGRSDFVFGSISDAYASFDDTVQGDSGTIARSVATGGFEGIYWLLSVQRLLAGTSSQEVSIRSSSFDEPLTPTAFTARNCSTRGNLDIQAAKVDSRGIFVHRSGKLVFELVYDVNSQDYASRNLTRLNDTICEAGVLDISVQRAPDTRIWFVLGDGTVALLTYEREDEVIAWTRIETAGVFESVCILPGEEEDEIYCVVRRTIQGAEIRYIEKLALETEAVCGLVNKTVDCHVLYSGAATATLSAPWLAGRQVVGWADGLPVAAPVTVAANGDIPMPRTVQNAVMGLAYPNGGTIKSTKLAYSASKGTALFQRKRVDHLGLLMAHVAPEGVRIGKDTASLMRFATTYGGRPLAPGEVVDFYDQDMSGFNGGWDTDSRVVIQVQSPYGATIMGMAIGMTTNEHSVGGAQQAAPAQAAPQSAKGRGS